ncbi:hypothetical protein RS694_07015 [Rhodoferax saidenbachensis]|uniref:HTH araC/xylS-type domain-containing protein n=2 Tax=Rhodoferax saidenbachensis TaxID=1484693 RepID=A0A1P8K8J1_9BURK|nr:hypothetical protein RS694_07015 [Rhodoferax saidenbachensis]
MMDKPSKFHIRSTNPDEASDFLSSAYAPVKARSIGCAFDIDVKGVARSGVGVFQTQSASGLTFECERDFDGYTLAVAHSGHLAVNFSSGHKPGHPSPGTLVVDRQGIKGAQFAAGLQFKGLSFRSDLIHRQLAEMIGTPVHGRVQFTPNPAQQSGVVPLMIAMADVWMAGMHDSSALEDAPTAMASLAESLGRLMLEGIPNNYTERLRGRANLLPAPHHVIRAIDFMRHNARQPLTLTSIASAAGTSVRSLQEGFRKYRSATPMGYLRSIRLEGARQDLSDPTQTSSILLIAHRWGFAHVGMFAGYYKSAFGEAPSATLKKRQ